MGFQCTGCCPIQTMKGCCFHCETNFDSYKTKDNEHFWSDKNGFLTPTGCALGEQRPQRCKEYDCRDYEWVVTKKWINGNWQNVDIKEIPIGCKVAGTIRIGKKNGNSSRVRCEP